MSTVPAAGNDAVGSMQPSPPVEVSGAETLPLSLPELATPAPPVEEEGAIVVNAEGLETPGDPLEKLNAQSFEAVQAVDRVFVGPVAHAYESVLPEPLRDGVHNVLNELEQPTVFVNDLLQLRPGRAVRTLGRFVINATLGIGGLFDVARRKPFNLPSRRNGFAYTLGYYGVKPGAYLFLPLIGSTTIRDLPGRILDLSLLSVAIGKPFNRPEYSIGRGVLASIDERLLLDGELERIRERNADPYAAMREYYMTKRQAEIDALRAKDEKVAPPAIEPVSAAPSP